MTTPPKKGSTLRSPRPMASKLKLSNKSVPVLDFLDALEHMGVFPAERAVNRVPEPRAARYDSRRASKDYFRCVLFCGAVVRCRRALLLKRAGWSVLRSLAPVSPVVSPRLDVGGLHDDFGECAADE